jgi:hypothetical protein
MKYVLYDANDVEKVLILFSGIFVDLPVTFWDTVWFKLFGKRPHRKLCKDFLGFWRGLRRTSIQQTIVVEVEYADAMDRLIALFPQEFSLGDFQVSSVDLELARVRNDRAVMSVFDFRAPDDCDRNAIVRVLEAGQKVEST